MATQTPLETGSRSICCPGSSGSKIQPVPILVDNSRQLAPRNLSRCSEDQPFPIHLHRQLQHGLGCPCCQSNRLRPMVGGTETFSHQCPGTLAVLLGLQAFVSHLSHSNVAIMCDNMTAIAYVKIQGGTHSETMCTLTSQICLWAERHKINMVARHVPSHLNVLSDSLSRKNQILKSEWSMNPAIVNKVFRNWGSPHVDLFALKQNTKLPVFMSPIPDKTAWKVDCLIQNWRNLYA